MRRFILLTEIHRIQMLLLEGRIDTLREKYKDKLLKYLTSTLDQNVKNAFYQNGEPNVAALFDYVVSLDPDPQKKNTQWLLNIMTSGRIGFEDLEKAPGYLTTWMEKKKKRELPPEAMDLGRFKNLGELYTAITDSNTSMAMAQDAEWQEAIDNSTVLMTGPRLFIAIPNTEEAAKYFGRETEWCTAWGDPKGRHPTRRCHYSSYAKDGPLYVIIDNQTGNRWQFHFESGQFMDVGDSSIDVGLLVRKYPEIMTALGEDRFRTYAKKIGFSKFTKNPLFGNGQTWDDVPVATVAEYVADMQDFAAVPDDIKYDPEFMVKLAKNKLDFFASLPEDYYNDSLEMIIPLVPDLLKFLPEHLQTTELAMLVLPTCRNAHELSNRIPKELWNSTIEDKMFEFGLEFQPLSRVPERFRSRDVIYNSLMRHPDEIPEFVDLLDEELAQRILNSNIFAAPRFPTQYLTAENVEMYVFRVVLQTSRSVSSRNEGLAWVKSLPDALMMKDTVKGLLRNGEYKFADVPEKYRSEMDIIEPFFMNERRMRNELSDIPEQYFTPDVKTKFVDFGTLPYCNPDAIEPSDVVRIVDDYVSKTTAENRRYSGYGYRNSSSTYTDISAVLSKYYDRLNERFPWFKSNTTVRDLFAKHAAVPVENLPDDPDMIKQRLVKFPAESRDIPKHLITEDFAEWMGNIIPIAFNTVPKEYLTEPVMYGCMRGMSKRRIYDKVNREEIFNLFDKSSWSPRVIAEAFRDRIISTDRISELPAGMLTKQVAIGAIIQDPKMVDELPKELIDDETLVPAIEHSYSGILKKLTPEITTTAVAHAALKKFASSGQFNTNHIYYKPGHAGKNPDSAALSTIPRDAWGYQEYFMAAGQVFDMNEVPTKFRRKPLMAAAILRDPYNVRYLKDPAKWMNDNSTYLEKSALSENLKDKKWIDLTEANGLIKVKGQGFVNTHDLEQYPISSGGFVTKIKSAAGYRVYYFNKRGKFVLRMYGGKDGIAAPEWTEGTKYKRQLLEVAQTQFMHVSAGDLTKLGIFSSGHGEGKKFYLEDDGTWKTSGQLEYMVNEASGRSTLVVRHGKKELLRTSSKRNHNYNWDEVDTTVPDPMAAIPYITDMLSIIRRDGKCYSWKMATMGIIATNRGGWGRHSLYDTAYIPKDKVVAIQGDEEYSVWMNDRRAGVFCPSKGMIATATVLKSGKITKIATLYGNSDKSAQVNEAFMEAEKILMKQRSGK